jgi:hypothetical protein
LSLSVVAVAVEQDTKELLVQLAVVEVEVLHQVSLAS